MGLKEDKRWKQSLHPKCQRAKEDKQNADRVLSCDSYSLASHHTSAHTGHLVAFEKLFLALTPLPACLPNHSYPRFFTLLIRPSPHSFPTSTSAVAIPLMCHTEVNIRMSSVLCMLVTYIHYT